MGRQGWGQTPPPGTQTLPCVRTLGQSRPVLLLRPSDPISEMDRQV